MLVRNVHSRELNISFERAAPLIDRLASPDDILWPRDRWPPMRFDRPFQVGAQGGHGPIRYQIEEYKPGRRVRFRFRRPAGFNGGHYFGVESTAADRVKLSHVLEMDATAGARLSWPLVFRPLHDALIEDALDRAETFADGKPREPHWSVSVRTLRWLLRRRRRS
jgi:hypothetical protein